MGIPITPADVGKQVQDVNASIGSTIMTALPDEVKPLFEQFIGQMMTLTRDNARLVNLVAYAENRNDRLADRLSEEAVKLGAVQERYVRTKRDLRLAEELTNRLRNDINRLQQHLDRKLNITINEEEEA